MQLIFLQYIPWFLRMSRPGEKITRKTIMMQKKMKEMEQKEISSKSLLANVLDIDDNFRSSTLPHGVSSHPSHVKPPLPNGCSVCQHYKDEFTTTTILSFVHKLSPMLIYIGCRC